MSSHFHVLYTRKHTYTHTRVHTRAHTIYKISRDSLPKHRSTQAWKKKKLASSTHELYSYSSDESYRICLDLPEWLILMVPGLPTVVEGSWDADTQAEDNLARVLLA